MCGLEVLIEIIERMAVVVACVLVTLIGMALAVGLIWELYI